MFILCPVQIWYTDQGPLISEKLELIGSLRKTGQENLLNHQSLSHALPDFVEIW